MNLQELQQTVTAIGIELSNIDPRSKWELDPEKGHSSYAILDNTNNPPESIAFCHQEKNNRFDISGNWPYSSSANGRHLLAPTRPYNHIGPWYSFGCTAAKSPTVIAKSIIRLLLPEYRQKLTEILDMEQLRKNDINTREKLAEGVCTILEIPYRLDQKSNHGYTQVILPREHCVGIDSLEVEIASETDFRFKIELSNILLSVEILGCIKKWIESHPKPAEPQINVAETFRMLIDKKEV